MKAFALILASGLLVACTKPACPWAWVPGTRIEVCSADALTVTSTATPPQLAAAFRAHGYAIARDATWQPTDQRMIVIAGDRRFLVDYAGEAVTLQPLVGERTLVME